VGSLGDHPSVPLGHLGGIAGWVNYGWAEPVYYSYGDNIYYEGDTVYYGDQAVATAEEYAEQAEVIAASAPEVAPDQAEWMPLGVFALTPDGQASGPNPRCSCNWRSARRGSSPAR
jgi:hypothetical protein